MICVYTGLPGAGKSLTLAQRVLLILKRNERFYLKTKVLRKVYTNLKLSDEILNKYYDFLDYWKDTSQLTLLRDCDVIWDEMAASLDNTQWQNMSLELKRWLQQHRKYGIEIYGTAQDFAQIDKSARRLVSHLYWIRKLIGSRDPSPTRPIPKYIWGICMSFNLDPLTYDELKMKQSHGLPNDILFFTKRDTQIFDTRAEVPLGEYPPLRHIARMCELHSCTHVKITHV